MEGWSTAFATPEGRVKLRQYQHEAVERVRAEFTAGHRRVLLVAPTGSGKTVMFAALAASHAAAGRRVIVVAHRRELLTQAAGKLRASGIRDVGIHRGRANSTNPDAPVQVVAIQALRSGAFPADLVIVDEAHHTPAESYKKLLDLYPDAEHLGATATPWWGAGKGLGDYFQAAVVATTVRELTDAGYLARVRMFTHPHTLRDLNLRGVKQSGGDYDITAVSARVDRPALLGDMVEHWQSHAGGARTLAFAASVEHSKHIVERFRAAGIAAEHLDGKTPDDERAAILARLASGETRIVSNYNVLTEGFDAPAVGCVILARPTKRAGVYLQAVGRGMRVDGENTSVVVLDHAGGCITHGLPDEERAVRLDVVETERGGGVPVRRCPCCGLCVPLGTLECPECAETLRGAVPTEEPSGALVEVLADDEYAVTAHGKTQSAVQWSRETGLSYHMIRRRILSGESGEDVLRAPDRAKRVLTFNGETRSAKGWASHLRMSATTIASRMARGLPAEVVLHVGPLLQRAPVAPVARRVKLITISGRSMTADEWARESGLKPDTIRRRLANGVAGASLLAPLDTSRKGQTLTVGGVTRSVSEWARVTGIPRKTINQRIKAGWSPESCVSRILSPKERGARGAAAYRAQRAER